MTSTAAMCTSRPRATCPSCRWGAISKSGGGAKDGRLGRLRLQPGRGGPGADETRGQRRRGAQCAPPPFNTPHIPPSLATLLCAFPFSPLPSPPPPPFRPPQGYKELYTKKWSFTKELAYQIEAGLQKMFEAKADVNKMKAELALKNQELAQAAKESEALLKQVRRQCGPGGSAWRGMQAQGLIGRRT